MSIFPVGLIVALVSFALSIRFLHQSVNSYVDLVAFAIVMGGTSAVFLIVIPWDLRKNVLSMFRSLVVRKSPGYSAVVKDSLDFIRNGEEALKSYDKANLPLHVQLLADGAEMQGLGFEVDRIESILVERLQQNLRRRRRVANAIRSLAKYPPAFGLMGTVLGLVNVMRGVSTGMDGKQTALEMAIALVATMYGLLLANMFISPAGELAQRESQELEIFGEISITAFRLWAEKTSYLESQETLNSFVPVEYRVSPESSAGEFAA